MTHCPRFYREGRESVFLRIMLQVVREKQWNVLLTLAQRGKRNAYDVEAEKQILAKLSFAHHRLERTIGSRNEADIELERFIAPHALNCLRLEKAQQFYLCAL